MHPKQQITLSFTRLLTLSLRYDDFIELPIDEAVLIDSIDTSKLFCHVEFPDQHNSITKPRLWEIKAWRASVIKHERAKKEADARRIEFDNYKTNVNVIAEKLMMMTKLPLEDCLNLAQKMLLKGPDSLEAIGIKLVKPYYVGNYVVLPCKMNYYE